MIYKEFGKTGMKVSALGMGVSRFSPTQYDTEEGMWQCADLVVKAWENGINYFDTAPTYCNWKSEQIMGLAVKKMKGNYYISNKSSSTMDATGDALRRRLDTTLKNMNVSKIAIYNMWGILNYQQYLDVIKPGGPYEGALAAKREGLIEHICFSAHCTGEEIERILEDDRFEGMTIGYNAINFKFREKGLEAAKRKGIGVATMNPLNGGVIPQNPKRFDFIKSDANQTLAQAGLLFNASHDAVSVALSGMTTEQELLENVRAFSEFAPFTEEKIVEIKSKIESSFDSLCTGCNYCAGCPQKIPINQLMLSYNQYILTNYSVEELRKYMFDVWRYGAEVEFKCKKCGYCEKKCTQHLSIIKRIEQMNQFAQEYLENTIKPSLMECFGDVKGKKIGIYASGPFAKRALDLYQRVVGSIDFELYFFDSNEQKWGKDAVLDGYKVYPPNQIESMKIDEILIASEAFYEEIKKSLIPLQEKGITIKGIRL
ncbi:MAG: aldo/keto reductase [Lachnospiraceae bacterium]